MSKDYSSSLLKDILNYRGWGEKWFEPFDKLSLMDQALLMTKWCIIPEEMDTFEFDKQDMKVWKELVVKGYYFLITTCALNVYTFFMFRRMAQYKDYGVF